MQLSQVRNDFVLKIESAYFIALHVQKIIAGLNIPLREDVQEDLHQPPELEVNKVVEAGKGAIRAKQVNRLAFRQVNGDDSTDAHAVDTDFLVPELVLHVLINVLDIAKQPLNRLRAEWNVREKEGKAIR